LRISLSAAHREQDVDRLLASLRALIVADTSRAKPA
jgi:7-keto-8-aminopelargonate synthetase-like enzyme